MAITERDEERVEYAFVMAFLPDLPENDETADKALEALYWSTFLVTLCSKNNLMKTRFHQ